MNRLETTKTKIKKAQAELIGPLKTAGQSRRQKQMWMISDLEHELTLIQSEEKKLDKDGSLEAYEDWDKTSSRIEKRLYLADSAIASAASLLWRACLERLDAQVEMQDELGLVNDVAQRLGLSEFTIYSGTKSLPWRVRSPANVRELFGVVCDQVKMLAEMGGVPADADVTWIIGKR